MRDWWMNEINVIKIILGLRRVEVNCTMEREENYGMWNGNGEFWGTEWVSWHNDEDLKKPLSLRNTNSSSEFSFLIDKVQEMKKMWQNE